jgi:hypothetical protein
MVGLKIVLIPAEYQQRMRMRPLKRVLLRRRYLGPLNCEHELAVKMAPRTFFFKETALFLAVPA